MTSSTYIDIEKIQTARHQLQMLDDATITRILTACSQLLALRQSDLIKANAQDLAKMPAEDPRYDRLLLNEARIQAMSADLIKIANLRSPCDRILEETTRPNGLLLQRISVPMGVVGIIYEARPNVTIDAFALCFRSSNICILKGGSDAEHSNRALVGIIHDSLRQFGVVPECVTLLPSERSYVDVLLKASGLVDVVIPRGSQKLIEYVRANSQVPIIETGAGVVHVYFDETGEVKIGKAIIDNAKTRRVSVCNALDTLIVHQKRLPDLPELVQTLGEKNVEIFADELAFAALSQKYPAELLHRAHPEDYGREFLSLKMAIKTVSNLGEALTHIELHGSKHSEAIVTESKNAADIFQKQVDAAAVYVNASTAFTDGGEFGLGAEIGISTQKLHVRGPFALEGLTTYKWLIKGTGQIRK